MVVVKTVECGCDRATAAVAVDASVWQYRMASEVVDP